MKRRVLLAGVGLSSVGVGAAFGSGAFTTISADRDVELNVVSDDDAQIIFKKGQGIGADRLVGTDDSNAVDVIEFSRDDLNEQSKTSFENALEVENNTDENGDGLTVELYVQDDDKISAEDEDILDFRIDDDGNGDTRSIVGEGHQTELSPTDGEEIDVVVDLRGDDANDGGDDLEDIDRVTFVVEAVDSD